MTEKRGQGGKFLKGTKPGPGRPKGSGHVQQCKEWAEKEGWQRLIRIAAGEPFVQKIHGGKMIGETEATLPADGSLQLEAIKLLLAYGYGRPTEKHAFDGDSQGRFILVCPGGAAQ